MGLDSLIALSPGLRCLGAASHRPRSVAARNYGYGISWGLRCAVLWISVTYLHPCGATLWSATENRRATGSGATPDRPVGPGQPGPTEPWELPSSLPFRWRRVTVAPQSGVSG